MSGYDGTLDVPDDPIPVSGQPKPPAICSRCRCDLYWDDDPDCGQEGCPVDENEEVIQKCQWT